MEKLEATKQLKAHMEAQHMPPELIDRINKKYGQEIVETLDKL